MYCSWQEAGFYTVESVVYAPRKKLTDVKGRSSYYPATALRIRIRLTRFQSDWFILFKVILNLQRKYLKKTQNSALKTVPNKQFNRKKFFVYHCFITYFLFWQRLSCRNNGTGSELFSTLLNNFQILYRCSATFMRDGLAILGNLRTESWQDSGRRIQAGAHRVHNSHRYHNPSFP